MTKVSSAKKELGLDERRDYVRYLKESNWGKQRWRIGFGLLFIGTCLVIGYFLFRHQDSVIQIFEQAGSIGVFGFVIAISIAIILLLPTPILKIFAGAVFPLHIALFINFIGTILGGFGAFFFDLAIFVVGASYLPTAAAAISRWTKHSGLAYGERQQ